MVVVLVASPLDQLGTLPVLIKRSLRLLLSLVHTSMEQVPSCVIEGSMRVLMSANSRRRRPVVLVDCIILVEGIFILLGQWWLCKLHLCLQGLLPANLE